MSEPTRRRPSFSAMTFLRLWLWAGGLFVACFLIWMIAPVLFLLLALTAAIGLVCAAFIKLARLLEAWKQKP